MEQVVKPQSSRARPNLRCRVGRCDALKVGSVRKLGRLSGDLKDGGKDRVHVRVRTTVRARLQCKDPQAETSGFDENALKITADSVLKNVGCGRPLSAVTAAAAAFAASTPAALAEENVFQEVFTVDFFGYQLDHRTLLYTIVLGQFIGFIGATVGGLEAKRSKKEVEELNKRLVAVNKQLRSQAMITKTGEYTPMRLSVDKEGKSPEELQLRDEVVDLLRRGKELLKESDGQGAQTLFAQALEATKRAGNALDSPWKAERKALRGMGAALQLQNDHKQALEYMHRVLAMCQEHEEEIGKGDALGVIADLYTDLGDMENAAKYYDEYILFMDSH